MSHGGNIYYFQQEPYAAKETYDIKLESKNFTAGTKQAWGLYRITPGGEVTKSVVKSQEPGAFGGNYYPVDDNQMLFFFVGIKKARPVYVSF